MVLISRGRQVKQIVFFGLSLVILGTNLFQVCELPQLFGQLGSGAVIIVLVRNQASCFW